MKTFDIFVTYISWGEAGKHRPVLVVEQSNSIVSVFKITTQYSTKSDSIRAKYYPIKDWRQAGLASQSYVDTNEILDIPLSAFGGTFAIGELSENDIEGLVAFLAKGYED